MGHFKIFIKGSEKQKFDVSQYKRFLVNVFIIKIFFFEIRNM